VRASGRTSLSIGLKVDLVDLAAFFFVRGFPAEAARRAFPGAAVRGCRGMILWLPIERQARLDQDWCLRLASKCFINTLGKVHSFG
jgi:hypothetical protein